MSADREFIGDAGLTTVKSFIGALLIGLGALIILGFAVMVHGIRRALPGYQTAEGFFPGPTPIPLANVPVDYHRILVGLDRLLAIFDEPDVIITPDDVLLRNRLLLARAHSLRAESGHPFPSAPVSVRKTERL